MKETKLIRLLRAFSKEEWKEFEKFADSPYFNKGRNYIPLIKELKKFYPEFESEKMNREYFYGRLFPGKPFKISVINTTLSGLYKLAEEFLAYENFRSNWNISPILLKELSIKNMNSEVEGLIKQTEKVYKASEIGAYDYYDKRHMSEEILNHYIRTDDRKKENEYLLKTFMDTIYHLFNQVFIIQNYLFINRNFSGSETNYGIIENVMSNINSPKIIELIEKTDKQNAIQFLISYYSFMANTLKDNYEYFNSIKNLAERFEDKLNESMRVRINSALCNICLRNITSCKLEFHKEFEQIYTKIIRDNEYYIDDRKYYFDKRLFKAIIVTSLYLKKIKWTEGFLKEFNDKTDPQFKQHLVQYGMACIEFSKGNFEKALNHASKIEQKQVIYKIDTKNLIARIYLETKSYEALLSLIDSYKHLIKNSSLNDEEYASSHSGFVKVIEKLVKIIQDDNLKDDIRELKNYAIKTNPLNNKHWLLEKISELEKQH